jgi:adenine-specific DNA-methyltransferase
MKTRVGNRRPPIRMPSLDFKGKQFVYTHHLTVLFRELVVDAKKSLPAKGKPSMDDNLIIHGDNLHALKALLPRYAGKVKCIYIDPPYNTGNEGWCYNDNVRSPLMQEWVKHGNPVERKDMERHDKWLSMMWPRLNLLRELLSDDGTIFMSIDDNERHHLHDIMDEIFGADNFVANIVWEKKYAVQSDSKSFSTNHDHIVAYAKNGKIWQPNHLVKHDKQLKNYKNSNNDPNGLWQSAVYT